MADSNKYALLVQVQTAFLPEQSSIAENRFAFAYTVTITNIGNIAAQLISRHWVITDANNQVQEVKGLGVVGAQPLLQPNEKFEYTSGTVLKTPVGSMHGTYKIAAIDGTFFDAIIETFSLSQPRVLH